ncbi:MAG: hypothetical protein E7228_04035 [Clostridiales bacterium]|nr:hypothetical protein [Clostridiales bacterium]
MLEHERDRYSNERITEATKLVSDAKKYLKDNALREAVICDYKAIFTGMRAVLAIDDIFPEDDYNTERLYRSRYIDNGMMSEEFVTTLDKICEYYDKIESDENFKAGKPEAGFFTSKAGFLVIECSDYIVQRNALYWGQ